MRFAFLLLALAAAYGQSGGEPQEILTRARARLQTMTHRLANYACIETVNRKYFQRAEERAAPTAGAVCRKGSPDGQKVEETDRLRLEVTVTQGGEIQAWPGATKFDARGVDEIIRQGPIAAGAFATYLLDVFDNPGVVFQYSGEKTSEGRKYLEYSYHVPLAASHYRVKLGTVWTATAYDGSFLIEPVSLDLQRLTLRTEELPASGAICEAETTLDYQPVRIGDSDVLLPRQSQLHLVLRDGRETNNITTFSECREYEAQSTVSFGDGAGGETAAAKPVVRSPVALTIGLPVTLALESPIDTANAAAGDAVSAKVVKPVRRLGSKETLIAAGAIVRGRITRVEHHFLPEPYFLIAIAFNRLELKAGSSPFAARLDSDPELARRLSANLAGRGRGVEFWDVGTFLFPTAKSRYVLPAGFESKWFTLATGAQ